ncbi:MAG TPA: TagF domain-containing protein, partial [Polyangiales bacterium]|nr:TagF domain-containing protein [Polyangiales bacterium]
AFDEWLQAASQQLAQRNAAWPGLETSFVFVAPTAALVGLLMPSRDRARRAFPIAVYCHAPREAPAAALALAGLRFRDDARLLVASLHDGDATARGDALASLTPCSSAEIASAELELELALELPASSLGRGEQQGPTCAALLRSLDAVRAGPRQSALNCTVSTVEQVAAWSAVVQRVLSPLEQPGSAFWSLGASRLLIAPAAPPAAIPLWLADTTLRASALHPLQVDEQSPQREPNGEQTVQQLIGSLRREMEAAHE